MVEGLPPELVMLAQSQRGAVTGAQLRAAVGDRTLMRLIRDGTVVRLWRNGYALSAESTSPRPDWKPHGWAWDVR